LTNPRLSCKLLGYQIVGWWCGVAVTRCVESTKLLYGGPG